MKDTIVDLPILPLPVFLLPGGITRLRIFEPYHFKLIKLATQGEGFVICLNPQEPKKPIIKWGSWVEVVNFDQGKDGVLEIDVKCNALVDIQSLHKDLDNLYMGKVCEIFHWSQARDDSTVSELGDSLAEVFVNDTMLSELYLNRFSQNTSWVVARWLEILPVNLTVKSAFVDAHNYDEAKYFVQSIIGLDKKN